MAGCRDPHEDAIDKRQGARGVCSVSRLPLQRARPSLPDALVRGSPCMPPVLAAGSRWRYFPGTFLAGQLLSSAPPSPPARAGRRGAGARDFARAAVGSRDGGRCRAGARDGGVARARRAERSGRGRARARGGDARCSRAARCGGSMAACWGWMDPRPPGQGAHTIYPRVSLTE